MPTTTTLTTDRNGHRVQADLGLDCHQLDAGTAVARVPPQTAIQRSPLDVVAEGRRSTLDTMARWTLLAAYAIAGVALTLWALLSRGAFY